MKINVLTGALVPAGILMLAACETSAPHYDPVLPMKAPAAAGSTVIFISQLPEKPTASDIPIDTSSAHTTAMNMVNTGQASPAAGAAGGIIAGLLIAAIDAGIDANRNGNFRSMLADRNVEVEEEFRAALLAAFEARGIAIEQPDHARAKKGLQEHAALEKLGTHPVLDIVIQQYGYSLGFGTGWAPSVIAELRLTDPSSGEILMAETLVYGSPASQAFAPQPPATAIYNTPGNTAIILPYDRTHTFASPNAFIEDDPELAVTALRFALLSAADAIANVLAPLPPQEPAMAEGGPLAEAAELAEAGATTADTVIE